MAAQAAAKKPRLPPYDPEISQLDDSQHRPIPSTLDELAELRRGEPSTDAQILGDSDLSVRDITIPSPMRDIPGIVLSRSIATTSARPRPGIIFFHGGGRVMGNVYVGLQTMVAIVKDADAIVFSIDYRLAPEFHGIKAVEDCYASLLWLHANFQCFNIDSTRFMIAGVSAGAGLAAGTALMSRDCNGPKLCAQLLMCPMLDDRCSSLSCKQFEDGFGFYTKWNRYAWSCVLGSQAGTEDVSFYVAPGRATDLTNLPLAYIDAGSGEPFRDEDVAYAARLWECGVQAHLHIWGGGCHGFDLFYESQLGVQATMTRNAWLRNILRERPTSS